VPGLSGQWRAGAPGQRRRPAGPGTFIFPPGRCRPPGRRRQPRRRRETEEDNGEEARRRDSNVEKERLRGSEVYGEREGGRKKKKKAPQSFYRPL